MVKENYWRPAESKWLWWPLWTGGEKQLFIGTRSSIPGAKGVVDLLPRWHSIWDSSCHWSHRLINLIRSSAVLLSTTQVQSLVVWGRGRNYHVCVFQELAGGWPARGGYIWSIVVPGGSSSISFDLDFPALIVWAEKAKWLLLHFTHYISPQNAFWGAPKPETLLGVLGAWFSLAEMFRNSSE